MKNMRLRHKKLAKKRAQRKDFRKRLYINRNVPTKKEEERIEKYRSVEEKNVLVGREYRNGKFVEVIKNVQRFKANGSPKIEHVGYKTKIKKTKQYRFHVKGKRHEPLEDSADREVGMIAYPMSKKYRGRAKKTLKNNN